MRRKRTLNETALHRNPFRLLGATPRDNRRRIVELARERSLDLEPDVCQKASSDLVNPRTRLAAEMSWLPGVPPTKMAQLTDVLLSDPMAIRDMRGLPTLAHANLMAAAFEAVDYLDEPDDIGAFIQELAELVDDLAVAEVMLSINKDRALSGFPEITATDKVEAELVERKRLFRNVIRDALDKLPSVSLIKAVTLAVDSSTSGGKDQAPELIDALVDRYETETQSFLQQEAENVHKLITAVRNIAKLGESTVSPMVDKLEVVVRNWDKVAEPIQISAKARGTDHKPSIDMAFAIRELAIELFNEHGMLGQSKRITVLLQELFAKLPGVLECVKQDANTLEEIVRGRAEAKSRQDEWE